MTVASSKFIFSLTLRLCGLNFTLIQSSNFAVNSYVSNSYLYRRIVALIISCCSIFLTYLDHYHGLNNYSDSNSATAADAFFYEFAYNITSVCSTPPTQRVSFRTSNPKISSSVLYGRPNWYLHRVLLCKLPSYVESCKP